MTGCRKVGPDDSDGCVDCWPKTKVDGVVEVDDDWPKTIVFDDFFDISPNASAEAVVAEKIYFFYLDSLMMKKLTCCN